MMRIREKRGSYTIFIAMLFSGILILVMAVVWASIEKGVFSSVDSFGRLWGQSIISEYDTFLKDRYGLYAFSGNNYDTYSKLEFYESYSADLTKYVKSSEIFIDLDDYHITDTESFKKQIEEAYIKGFSPKIFYKSETGESANATSGSRCVTAGWIIDELPSKKASSGGSSVIDIICDSQSLLFVCEMPVVSRYVFKFFRNHNSDDANGDTLFQNEVEYIISGKLYDQKAYENVKTKLLLLRTSLNAAYIWSCPEKANLCLSFGTLMFPELTPPVAQALLVESWAGLEASNDLKILEDKKKVPFRKSDRNFALSFNSMLSQEFGYKTEDKAYEEKGSSKMDYVKPQVIEGEDYEDYLKVLLLEVPERTMLQRMEDLIQLNAKYLYCDYFNLNECYTGLDYEIKVNGRTQEFTASYDN